ncbi:hypothetical protein [Ktedonobacter robiniae]|uniref:Uncharacterized protein n=1 Tax=Ktedonobacter robiniae TaxID=2778365 RepID=A0ABQ3USS9_9CHLR|nr:hypothetical protein [Ktedonobacter robiniae]GHO55756.1 hypothetical protein KSB_42310 [Ktedonobacter robiniae]
MNRSRKIGPLLAGSAAIILLVRRWNRLDSIQSQFATRLVETQAQLDTMRQDFQVLLDARKRSTQRLIIFVNAIGLLSFAVAVMFLIALLCGVGASATTPTGLAGFVQRYASLAPACIDVGGVLLIARMMRSGEQRSQLSGNKGDWAPRTLATVVLYIVGTLLAYQSGKLVSAWYLPSYHATTSATINADNVVQAGVSWLFFVIQMKLVLDPPRWLRLRRNMEARQNLAAHSWLNSIAYLAGIVPLLVCVGVFIIPIFLGVGASGTPKGFAAFVQHQATFGPALFGAGCTLAIALMGRYADNNRGNVQDLRSPEEAARSWAKRLLVTYAINPVGVLSSYTSAKLVSRLYQQTYHHAAVLAVINVDNLWQATYGWLFYLPIPLIQVVFPTWNAKRRTKKMI